VIYRYDLPEAMEVGYVKEPAVGARADFDPKSVTEDVLERIKLEDGVHYHEHVKVALQTYAKQNDAPLVHPLMLAVTQDTTHARQVREFVESEQFFEGRYNGRVAEIHSKLTGEESDENARRHLTTADSLFLKRITRPKQQPFSKIARAMCAPKDSPLGGATG
jgi:type III restriction enzyme